MPHPPPIPLYVAGNLHPAYELRYGWTGWPSDTLLPIDLISQLLPKIAPEWENDGIRVLESSLAPEKLLLTLSARPQVSPVTLAARVKGRLQHHCRLAGNRVAFSRKVSIRSIGHNHRQQVEGYIAGQAAKESLADEHFRELLQRLSIIRNDVDLSQPSESNSGRYWYNLHMVLVTAARYRMGEDATVLKIRDTCMRIADKKGYAISTLAVMPDHVHLALRGAIGHSPEEIALAFLNNLAFALGQCAFWESGYYVGTFSEYDMDAVRSFVRSPATPAGSPGS
jgi:REP element-mobilizing transposase RayT